MKQRITIDNLLELSPSQKDRLNSIWIPDVYDLAAAYICRDAENEIYDIIEFVIGDIILQEAYGRKFVNITLRNIKSMYDDDNTADDEELPNEEAEYELQNLDIDLENVHMDFVNKNDCLPLLNIGQMMKILKEQGYGSGSFYIDINSNNDINSDNQNCGLGREITQFLSYGRDFEGIEICDALWDAVKAVL